MGKSRTYGTNSVELGNRRVRPRPACASSGSLGWRARNWTDPKLGWRLLTFRLPQTSGYMTATPYRYVGDGQADPVRVAGRQGWAQPIVWDFGSAARHHQAVRALAGRPPMGARAGFVHVAWARSHRRPARAEGPWPPKIYAETG